MKEFSMTRSLNSSFLIHLEELQDESSWLNFIQTIFPKATITAVKYEALLLTLEAHKNFLKSWFKKKNLKFNCTKVSTVDIFELIRGQFGA